MIRSLRLRAWLPSLVLPVLLFLLTAPLVSPGAAWAAPAQNAAQVQEAVLAGGCFWCLEHDLESLPGVLDAQSGYSGGTINWYAGDAHIDRGRSIRLV